MSVGGSVTGDRSPMVVKSSSGRQDAPVIVGLEELCTGVDSDDPQPWSGAGPDGLLGSDLKPHADDRVGNRPHADAVITGVGADELERLTDRDPMLLGGDPLCLFDDDP